MVSRLLEDRQIPARLLINRLRARPVMAGRMPDVDEIIDTAGLQLMGILPEDEAVAVANANGALCRRTATRRRASATSHGAFLVNRCLWQTLKK